MRDRVADVLAQRAALDRGAGTAIALSLLLHGGLTALVVYAALHAKPAQPVSTLNIQFASMPEMQPARRAESPPLQPKIQDVKPKIEEPKPQPPPEAPKTPEKNTVPLSPFGRSTKKGSETPPAPEAPAPATPAGTSTAPAVPVGGSGVTSLEGGDFPYTIYITTMIRHIGRYWSRPAMAGLEVVIYFKILRNGTIVESRVETSSGNPTFDRAALSAVRSSSPLQPLPFGFNGTYLGVHQTFR